MTPRRAACSCGQLEVEVTGEPGEVLWYLLRLDCSASSWSSGGASEQAGRDGNKVFVTSQNYDGALGGLAGINAAFALHGLPAPQPDSATAHGALLTHLMQASPRDFQPMNVNFGLFPPLDHSGGKLKKRVRLERMSERARAAIEPYCDRVAELLA